MRGFRASCYDAFSLLCVVAVMPQFGDASQPHGLRASHRIHRHFFISSSQEAVLQYRIERKRALTVVIALLQHRIMSSVASFNAAAGAGSSSGGHHGGGNDAAKEL